MLRFLMLFTQHAHEYLPKSILAMTRSRSVSSPSSMFKAPRMVRQDCAICNISLQATMTAATSRGSNAKRILGLLSVTIDLDPLRPLQLRLGAGHQHFQTRPRQNETVLVALHDETLLDQHRDACMQRIGRLAGQRLPFINSAAIPTRPCRVVRDRIKWSDESNQLRDVPSADAMRPLRSVDRRRGLHLRSYAPTK